MSAAPPMKAPRIDSDENTFSRVRVLGRSLYGKNKLRWYDTAKRFTKNSPPLMPQPPLRSQTQKEANARDRTPDDEQRLQDVRADVADVCDALSGGHGYVLGSAGEEPCEEEGEDCSEPDEGCEEWEGCVEEVEEGAAAVGGWVFSPSGSGLRRV